MDDGRLTDGQGRTVDFKNAVLIMTSNIPGGRDGRRGDVQARVHQPPRRHRRVRRRSTARRSADRRPPGRSGSSTACAHRGIDVELTDRARAAARRPGLRPDLRRAAAEARDPAAPRRPARAGDARGRLPRGRHGARRRRRRRPRAVDCGRAGRAGRGAGGRDDAVATRAGAGDTDKRWPSSRPPAICCAPRT